MCGMVWMWSRVSYDVQTILCRCLTMFRGTERGRHRWIVRESCLVNSVSSSTSSTHKGLHRVIIIIINHHHHHRRMEVREMCHEK